jgi:hypothetical protein
MAPDAIGVEEDSKVRVRRRIAVAVIVIFGGAIFLASGIPSLVATFVYVGVYQSLFPSTVSWDSHGAYVKCNGAIAGSSPWPATPAAACLAMHMCANEATLSDSQTKTLYDQIGKTPGCRAP